MSFYTEDTVGRPGPAVTAPGDSLFCLNVALHVKPDRRAEFLDAMRVDQAGALNSEPNAATYLFGEDASTPNTFHMFEQYIGRAGFEEHAQSPHYAAWAKFKATSPFAKPATVAYYNTIEGLSAAATADASAEAVGAPAPAGFAWGGTF